jgi:hypothetical protein
MLIIAASPELVIEKIFSELNLNSVHKINISITKVGDRTGFIRIYPDLNYPDLIYPDLISGWRGGPPKKL